MTKLNVPTVLLFLLLAGGCRHAPGGTAGFTYRYSMESAGNFKVELQLNPDSTYMIGRHDYFFDRFEGKKRPRYHEGKLTEEEYHTFSKLINSSRLEKMKDSYGFDTPDADGSAVYIVQLERGNQTKYVSVNGGAKLEFPRGFNRLIRYSTQFINDRDPD